MAKFYATAFAGLALSGTADVRLDARVVGARPRLIVAVKPDGQALTTADLLYVGRKRVGETIRRITATAGASLGTSTISVGTEAAPTKYVDTKTLTTVDIPTNLGPTAVAAAASPDGDYEDIWLKPGTATIAGATVLVIEMEIAGLN